MENNTLNTNAVPTLQSLFDSEKSNNLTEFSAGTIDESMLTEQEREIVDQYVKDIDIENIDQIVRYGEKAQQNVSDFSVSVLKKVKTRDLGDIGESLKELTMALDTTTKPQKKGIAGIFQKAKHSFDSIKASYVKAESNVDRIEADLKKHQEVLLQDISIYQQLFDLNLKYYKELTMYIIAGKKALALAKSGPLTELKSKANSSNLQEDVQNYRDFEDLCNRFEKKISDLEITRIISIQTAPQVRMLQNNDREMLDKLQSSLSNTIPLWRNQLIISLGIEHTKRALEAQTILSEKTNELLSRNSEMLKMATVETAKEAERSIVDIDVLRKCNKDLISSINEVVSIHEQAIVKREQVREELVKLEEELKQAMIDSTNH